MYWKRPLPASFACIRIPRPLAIAAQAAPAGSQSTSPSRSFSVHLRSTPPPLASPATRRKKSPPLLKAEGSGQCPGFLVDWILGWVAPAEARAWLKPGSPSPACRHAGFFVSFFASPAGAAFFGSTFFTSLTTYLVALSPSVLSRSALLILSDLASKVTFWVSPVSPARIWMLATPSNLLNASRTCALQPPHVTPVMVTE